MKLKIKDICLINQSTISSNDDIEEILYLDTSNLTQNVIASLQKYTLEEAPGRAQRKVHHDTIIYSCVRPNQKHFGIMSNPENNLIVSTGFITLDIKKEIKNAVNARFLYYMLTQDWVTSYLQTIAENSVSSYPSINPNDIGNLSFEFPNIEIQKEIATIIYSIDRKIALNRAINKNLEALATQLYDYWFVQFDFPDEEGKPYKSSGGKMIWNEKLKREIPEGWIVVTVNDIADSYRGVSYTKDDLVNEKDGVLVLRGNNIQDNQLIYDSNVAYIPESFVSDEQRIKKGHIIMTMSSGSKEHVGKCVLFNYDTIETYGAFLTKFVPHAHCSNLLYNVFNSEYFKAKIKSIASGTGINNLTNQTFDNIFIVMPPMELLQKFDALQTKIYDEVGNLQQNTWNLTMQRDELLPLLMNGQVTIKE